MTYMLVTLILCKWTSIHYLWRIILLSNANNWCIIVRLYLRVIIRRIIIEIIWCLLLFPGLSLRHKAFMVVVISVCNLYWLGMLRQIMLQAIVVGGCCWPVPKLLSLIYIVKIVLNWDEILLFCWLDVLCFLCVLWETRLRASSVRLFFRIFPWCLGLLNWWLSCSYKLLMMFL